MSQGKGQITSVSREKLNSFMQQQQSKKANNNCSLIKMKYVAHYHTGEKTTYQYNVWLCYIFPHWSIFLSLSQSVSITVMLHYKEIGHCITAKCDHTTM